MVWASLQPVGILPKLMESRKVPAGLVHHKIPSRKYLIGSSVIFQHDNDPRPKAKAYLGRKTRDEYCQSLSAAWRTIPENYVKKLLEIYL